MPQLHVVVILGREVSDFLLLLVPKLRARSLPQVRQILAWLPSSRQRQLRQDRL